MLRITSNKPWPCVCGCSLALPIYIAGWFQAVMNLYEFIIFVWYRLLLNGIVAPWFLVMFFCDRRWTRGVWFIG